jgi:hypothetical protein
MEWSGRAPALPAADAGLGCITSRNRYRESPLRGALRFARVSPPPKSNNFIAGHVAAPLVRASGRLFSFDGRSRTLAPSQWNNPYNHPLY